MLLETIEHLIIVTYHSVHLHPRYESTMNPPIKGASKGPVNTVIEKTVIANPRVLLSNISEKTAATTAKGHAPKMPGYSQHYICKSTRGSTNLPKVCKARSSEDPSQRQQLLEISKIQTWRESKVIVYP